MCTQVLSLVCVSLDVCRCMCGCMYAYSINSCLLGDNVYVRIHTT